MTALCRTSKFERPFSLRILSGIATPVAALSASSLNNPELVSRDLLQVYAACTCRPPENRRSTDTCIESYHESPLRLRVCRSAHLEFLLKAVLGVHKVPAGRIGFVALTAPALQGTPPDRTIGTGVFPSLRSTKCFPRDPT